MRFADFDLVAVTGTQQWGIFHSQDMTIRYGFTPEHGAFSQKFPEWDESQFLFSTKYVGIYRRHVEGQGLVVSPSPSRKVWTAPHFRNLGVSAGDVAEFAKLLTNVNADSITGLQSNFFLPLTLRIGDAEKPGFYVDHHAAHANYAAYYSDGTSIVVTHDGGDASVPFNSGGVYVNLKHAGIVPVASHGFVLGNIYDSVAFHFGLDAGKLMGLASYGRPNAFVDPIVVQYVDALRGSNPLPASVVATQILKSALLDKRVRRPDIGKLSFKFADVGLAVQAAANAQYFVQRVYVQQMSDICESIVQELDTCRNVYMTGGFSLNCPSNSNISHISPTLNYRPLPGVGDTGLPIGAAVALHYFFRQPMAFNDARDPMAPAFPPSCLDHTVGREPAVNLERIDCRAEDMATFLAGRLVEGQVICVHRGRSEVGPRALGHRSIIAWAGIEATRDRINALKGREDWRPLAPIVAVEDFHDYFVGDPEDCRFMLAVSKVKTRDIPAITHVDNTARVQVIDASETFLYPILLALKARGVAPVIVNTSFNCAGEPLVETFEHAARSFAKMGFELLVSEGELYRATGGVQVRPVPAAEEHPSGIRAA